VVELFSDTDCDGFTTRTGLALPDDLRDWLKLANGPCVGPGGLYGIRPPRPYLDIESVLARESGWKERGWIPIAGDGCGNFYVVPTQGEFGNGYPVFFVDMSFPDEPCYIVASDIGHFLLFLLEDELEKQDWPFDETYVVKSDPNIRSYKGIDLPWLTT
jgi:hypothetical protein